MDNSSIGLCDMQVPVPPLLSDCSAPSSLHAPPSLQALSYDSLHDNVARAVTSAYLQVLPRSHNMQNLSWFQVTTMLAICLVTYLSSLIVYRLYLSPVAAFPGPFLAKTTHWYEFYYTYIQTGMYYKKVAEFHARYGKSDRCQTMLSATDNVHTSPSGSRHTR
jgi:hypothetical protein